MTYILVGMPGSGKSCMGRAVARKLKLKNVDTDKLIEKRTGKKLQDIINEDGLEAFKKIEEETLLSIKDEGVVLSTGGSAIYYDEAMKHLKTLGPVIYLYTSLETVKNRIGDFSKRGVVLEPGQTLEELYNERTALYKKYADITVSCDGNAYSRYQAQLFNAITKFTDAKAK